MLPPPAPGVPPEGVPREKEHQDSNSVRNAKCQFDFTEKQERDDDRECSKENEKKYTHGS
jgi:hypothetical protein